MSKSHRGGERARRVTLPNEFIPSITRTGRDIQGLLRLVHFISTQNLNPKHIVFPLVKACLSIHNSEQEDPRRYKKMRHHSRKLPPVQIPDFLILCKLYEGKHETYKSKLLTVRKST